jgi:hypothetical protein
MREKLFSYLLLFVLVCGQGFSTAGFGVQTDQYLSSIEAGLSTDALPLYLPSAPQQDKGAFAKDYLPDFTFAEFLTSWPIGNLERGAIVFADQYHGWRSQAIVLLYPAHEFS